MSTARGKIAGQHVSGEGSLFDVPPAAIGRFRVLHQVGAGTSGPVFRAVHPDTDAALAIKLFTLPLAPDRLQDFADELSALVDTMPPVDGACELVDAGIHGATPFLVTTFADGDSLDVALKQFGPAAISDLVPRLRVLARALDAAADGDVLHGALHPRDVLVSENRTTMTGLGAWPLLMRFGGRLPIRRPYRAPELSDVSATAAGDRFALAAMAYEWMTGRRVPSAFVAGDMAPIAGADRDALGAVFARALNADPDERHDSAAEFVAEIADVDIEEAAISPVEPQRADSRDRRRVQRAGTGAARLPLEAFPAEADDSDEDDALRLTPVPRDEQQEAETPAAVPPPIAFPALPRFEEPTAAPAGAASLRSSQLVASPTSSLLREATPVRPTAGSSSASRSGRMFVGLVLGVALGLGAGYAVWGGVGSSSSGGNAPGSEPGTVAAPAPEGTTGAGAPVPPASVPEPAPSPRSEPGPGAPESPAQSPDNTPVPPAAAARPAPTGNLLVRSTPAGATVFVDDDRRGVTPLTLQNVELGTRRVRIQRDGYQSEDRQVTLTRSRPSRSVEVRLTRAAPAPRATTPAPAAPAARTGSLVIESRPTGAAIVLNGRRIGTTPMTVDDLEPGTYTVQLQLPTFRSVTTTVRVVAGARARAAASLVSLQEPQ